MQIAPVAPVVRAADRQPLPAALPAPVAAEPIEYDDPRIQQSFVDPDFDGADMNGDLTSGADWPMDFIYNPNVTHAAGATFLDAVASAKQLADAPNGGVTAVLQGRDGAFYLDDQLSAGFRGDGGGDWELRSGDLASVEVTVAAPEIVAVVDSDGWFDLRPA